MCSGVGGVAFIACCWFVGEEPLSELSSRGMVEDGPGSACCEFIGSESLEEFTALLSGWARRFLSMEEVVSTV